MSCNGCRVLRKGCSESCILRPCLQRIESPEAQGHATVFVAKFFGRAGLMSFISSVPENQRPAIFQSLLIEACGRTVNPVNGAVGLLWTGNWHVCQAAVETVLRGGTLRPISEIPIGMPESDEEVACADTMMQNQNHDPYGRSSSLKRNAPGALRSPECDLDLSLMSGFPASPLPEATTKAPVRSEKRRPESPSMMSEGSVTTTIESGGDQASGDRQLLNLFV